jgi:hypothetical protein
LGWSNDTKAEFNFLNLPNQKLFDLVIKNDLYCI